MDNVRLSSHATAPTCDGEHGVEAAVPVGQEQPVAHLDLVPLDRGGVHQGATNVAAQLEHLLVDVEILAIAAACRKVEWRVDVRELYGCV